APIAVTVRNGALLSVPQRLKNAERDRRHHEAGEGAGQNCDAIECLGWIVGRIAFQRGGAGIARAVEDIHRLSDGIRGEPRLRIDRASAEYSLKAELLRQSPRPDRDPPANRR